MNELFFKDRLKTLEKKLGMSPSEMAALFDCSISSYYRYRNGTSSPDIETLNKIFDLNDKINPAWLLNGKGSVFITENNIENSSTDFSGVTFRFYNLPMFHMRTTEKDREGKIRKREWSNPPGFFPVCSMFIEKMIGIKHERLFVITVDCNSMSPVIQPGSVVIADKQQKDIVNDGIFVVAFDEVIRLKLIQKYPGNKILLSSINEQFKPLIIKENREQKIEILGSIVWVGTPL